MEKELSYIFCPSAFDFTFLVVIRDSAELTVEFLLF